MRLLFGAAAVTACLCALVTWSGGRSQAASPSIGPTFASLGDAAIATVLTRWYAGNHSWQNCETANCGHSHGDWAADSMTTVLYERWLLTGDPTIVVAMRGLEDERRTVQANAPAASFSDVPVWDAVAAIRAFDVTRDVAALQHAQSAYGSVASGNRFGGGACPQIDYQISTHGGNLKTLETDANRLLAAILLYERTGTLAYRDDAVRLYGAIRAAFFDPPVGLYTVYVFDDGVKCAPLPHRFFASVNGVMIEAGLELARATGVSSYASDAQATAHAIRALSDARGIFTDLQAENDIVEPLVLAMLELARAGSAEASSWITSNAAVAIHAQTSSGSFGRFFDGPAPNVPVTLWQTNGGFGLMVAAAGLAPSGRAEAGDPWATATTVPVGITTSTLPASFSFTGSGIALLGTLFEHCSPAYPGDPMCDGGHAHVAIDGQPMVDQTGIWQNKGFVAPIRGSVLFAWRWPTTGHHTLQFAPGEQNGKEGGSFLDVTSALVLP